MRRSSTRRTGVVPAPAASTGTKPSSKEKEVDKVDALFNRYADKDNKLQIGPEGIEELCEHLHIATSDFRILLLAWKLKASKQGFFTADEWRSGLRALRVDTLDKLKTALAQLKNDVMAEPELHKEVYEFAFKYCLTEPRQKTLDLDTVCQMLRLVLEGRPHLEAFVQFVQKQTEYKVINLDQWTGFLRFCEEVDADMSNYDESQAWPLLLDNFVDWSRSEAA